VDGVIVVDKPVGISSFGVVARVRGAGRLRQVGHGGTLDPLASGVLPVCVGEGTKLAAFLLDADKEYEFAIRFGVETDTDDAGGSVTATADPSGIDEAAVERALAAFRGPISQVPPAYAAIKRDGRALYEYARAGEAVEVAAREVKVFALEVTRFAGPESVELRVHCSKGTYVRSLARDLGRALRAGAHVTALRRTRSGPFTLAAARPLDLVLAALRAGEARTMPLIGALPYPQVPVDDALGRRLRAGQRVGWAELGAGGAARVSVIDAVGRLVAVAEPRPDGLARTLRVFGVKPPGNAVDESAIL
jgi:tRNA pseudouridine55 synthase